MCATETFADPNLVNDCVSFSHPSGGWFSDIYLTGRFFWLWRDGAAVNGEKMFSIHKFAVFQAPNQTKHATPRSNCVASDPLLVIENLVSNLDNQCMRSNASPMTVAATGTVAAHRSCFKALVS